MKTCWVEKRNRYLLKNPDMHGWSGCRADQSDSTVLGCSRAEQSNPTTQLRIRTFMHLNTCTNALGSSLKLAPKLFLSWLNTSILWPKPVDLFCLLRP